MSKNRLEAFSDGVIAIIITIMVLELKTPHETSFYELFNLRYALLSYLLSFLYLAIYWNNHHHLFQAARHVNGAILWANMHLLFWLSLIPFVTAWTGEHGFAALPTALYGVVLFMASVAYTILVRSLTSQEGRGSVLASAIGKDTKGKISIALYGASIPLALVAPACALAIYAALALAWIIPDLRIEKRLKSEGREPGSPRG
jgi:uncharacterized membrane protein